jgi:hypothetical protein
MPRTPEQKAAKEAKALNTTPASDGKLPWVKFGDAAAKVGGGTAYGEWAKAKDLEEEKRLAFEEAFIKEMYNKGHLDESKSLRFSYNYGMAFQVIDRKDRSKYAGKKGEFTFD